MKTLESVRDLFSIFHDGTITRLKIENGICDLEVDIKYLASRMDPSFSAFRVRLFSVEDFYFTPWNGSEESPSSAIYDIGEIWAAELGILSAEIDGSKIKVACTQDLHPALDHSGGFLTFECSHGELFDEAGRLVGMAALRQMSASYWEDFSAERNA
ncbi:MAG: hypothetical protein V4584_18030 [Verrucomicrobiota bacterium]